MLKHFAYETRRANAGFTLLSIAHPRLLLSKAIDSSDERSAKQFERSIATDEQLAKFAAVNNFVTINLSEDLKPFVNKQDRYLYGFKNNKLGLGHFSEYGHEKTAEVLAKHFCEK